MSEGSFAEVIISFQNGVIRIYTQCKELQPTNNLRNASKNRLPVDLIVSSINGINNMLSMMISGTHFIEFYEEMIEW